MQNYVGKIVKLSGINSWGQDISIVGIVCAQTEGIDGDRTFFSVIKTDGTFTEKVTIKHDGNIKITSTKIEPELRTALKEAYKSKIKLDAFKLKYYKELEVHDNAFKTALKGVKENSNELTSSEFIDAVVDLFREQYPSSGSHYTKYFEADSWSSKEVSVRQVQDIEKWASPEKYSFLYREYDNTIHMSSDSKELQLFCERNAPSVIPELTKHCKTDVSASLGDKGWLAALRTYTFPIKYGYTKKSIEEIKERIFGIRSKQASINEQIADAQKSKLSSAEQSINKRKELER